jgi:hypothetical protein
MRRLHSITSSASESQPSVSAPNDRSDRDLDGEYHGQNRIFWDGHADNVSSPAGQVARNGDAQPAGNIFGVIKPKMGAIS